MTKQIPIHFYKKNKDDIKLQKIISFLIVICLLFICLFLNYVNKEINEITEEVKTINEEQNDIVEVIKLEEKNIVEARITCYSPTGNKTASGKEPKNGMVSVSDRAIKFGTEIYIDGLKYVVEDRTALWVGEEKGFTVDVFMEEGCDKNFGANIKDIIIKS